MRLLLVWGSGAAPPQNVLLFGGLEMRIFGAFCGPSDEHTIDETVEKISFYLS